MRQSSKLRSGNNSVILSIIGEGEGAEKETVSRRVSSTRDFIRSGRGAREIWQQARIFARETKIAPCAQCRARRVVVVNNFPKSPAPHVYIYIYISRERDINKYTNTAPRTYFQERLRPRVKECVLERMKGHEHFITCSIIVSK